MVAPHAPVPLHPQDVFDCARRISAAATLTDLRDTVHAFLRPYGFLGFTFAVVRRVKSLYLHARVVSTWPASSQSQFEQSVLFNADPIILRSRTATEPFAWTNAVYHPGDPTHAMLLSLRQQSGTDGGICVPIAEAFQGRSVLYLSGTGFDTSADSILALRLIAQHFAAHANSLNMPDGDQGRPGGVFRSDRELSPRECQVLGWIAFGKSSKDVALIMGISEHTVNDYIASAVHKLNASNRTEAVLRALLTNQIDLS
jgi:LuxR family quorum sensing-dependent transcriptional regulator